MFALTHVRSPAQKPHVDSIGLYRASARGELVAESPSVSDMSSAWLLGEQGYSKRTKLPIPQDNDWVE